mgnify:CR=1 FL=1
MAVVICLVLLVSQLWWPDDKSHEEDTEKNQKNKISTQILPFHVTIVQTKKAPFGAFFS